MTCPRHPQSGVWHHAEGDRCPICATFFDGRQAPPTQPSEVRSFANYRELVARSDKASFPLEYHAGCLCEESGEFFGKVKKVVYHGHARDEAMLAKMREELGDALWYLDRCAHRIGATLEEVAAENIAKLKRRYPEGFSNADSVARVDALPPGIELPPVSELIVTAPVIAPVPDGECSSHYHIPFAERGRGVYVRCVGSRHHDMDHRAPDLRTSGGVLTWSDEQEARCVGTYVDANHETPQLCSGHFGHRGPCGWVVPRSRPKVTPRAEVALRCRKCGLGGHERKDCPKRKTSAVVSR